MKKKVITALLITMTLTLGGVGTAYDMNNDMSILSGEAVNDVNMIKEGFIWVVDKESWTETIHHKEEGHYENGKLLEEEQGHYEEVVIKPAWEEEKYVVDKEAWTETVNHPEEGHYETVVIKPAWEEWVNKCHNCDYIYTDAESWKQHVLSTGHMSYGSFCIEHPAVTEDKWVVDKEAWTEEIKHPEEGHTETIKHPAETDDVWVVDKPAVYEQVWVVDKEAWTETITHPEEGHWEPVKDEEKPENPEQKPDEEKPETPEQKPDEEKPETPEQKPDEEAPENSENSNTDNKQDSTEDTSKDKTDNKADNKTDSKKEDTNTAPKTGDPTNLAYFATLAGSALVGGVSWKFRKRK